MSSQGSIVYYLFTRFKDVLQYSYESFNITIDLENEPHIYATFGNGILTSPIHISLTMSNGKLVVNNEISYDDLVNHYVDYNTLLYVTYDGEYYYPKLERSYYYNRPLVFEHYNAETSVRKTITFSTDSQDADNPWTYSEETIESGGDGSLWMIIRSSGDPEYPLEIAHQPIGKNTDKFEEKDIAEAIASGKEVVLFLERHPNNDDYPNFDLFRFKGIYINPSEPNITNYVFEGSGPSDVYTYPDLYGTSVNPLMSGYVILKRTIGSNSTSYSWSISSPGAIADWDASSTEPGYIANRIAYTDVQTETITLINSMICYFYPDNNTVHDKIAIPKGISILDLIGTPYTVTLTLSEEDPVVYTGEFVESYEDDLGGLVCAFGDAEDAEVPFFGEINPYGLLMVQMRTESIPANGIGLSLTIEAPIIHKLDDKYLNGTLVKDGIGYKSLVLTPLDLDSDFDTEQRAYGDYSIVEGAATASGNYSHGEGSANAQGDYSHAEGFNTVANHKSQHVSGEFNVEDPNTGTKSSRGNYVEIVGNGTGNSTRSNARTLDWSGNEWIAGTLKVGGTGYTDSNAKEIATKDYVDEHSGGADWNASQNEQGYIANKPSISAGTGSHSISEGYGTMAYYMYAHAEGYKTRASNHSSHAEGCYSVATGRDSHAEGTTVNSTDYIYLTGDANATTYTISQPITDNYVRGYLLSAGGFIYVDNANYTVLNVASNLSTITLDRSLSSQAISNKQVRVILSSVAFGQGSHAEGLSAATGAKSHSEGNMTIAEGAASHAEGHGSEASGVNSHAEGFSQASQENAHAEGNSQATGYCSHSEGKWTTASGGSSHAEGIESIASNSASHAEGQNTTASGLRSHSEGDYTTASGDESHAEGAWTTASGVHSHAEGFGTTANHQAQHVFGIYNIPDANTANADDKGTYIEIVGNGARQTPSNARTLDWNGNEWIKGNFKMGGTSYDDANAKEIATKDYVDETIANSVLSDAIITVSGTKLSITTNNT